MRFRWIKQEFVRLAAWVVVAYLGILVHIVATGDSRVFPAAYQVRPDRLTDLPADFQRVTLAASDGVKIAAYDCLIRTVGGDPSHVVLVAHSLGTGVAIDLAVRSRVGGLMADGACDSIPSCAADRYPWVPVALFVRNRFASVEKIGRVTVPKLFLHGGFDESIPIRRGRALFDAAPEPKSLVMLEGRHEDFQWSDSDRCREAVGNLARNLRLRETRRREMERPNS